MPRWLSLSLKTCRSWLACSGPSPVPSTSQIARRAKRQTDPRHEEAGKGGVEGWAIGRALHAYIMPWFFSFSLSLFPRQEPTPSQSASCSATPRLPGSGSDNVTPQQTPNSSVRKRQFASAARLDASPNLNKSERSKLKENKKRRKEQPRKKKKRQP